MMKELITPYTVKSPNKRHFLDNEIQLLCPL